MTQQVNERLLTLVNIVISFLLLLALVSSGIFVDKESLKINMGAKSMSPSIVHLFGTDWLGRDMLARTLKGLTLSFFIGILTSFISVLLALTFSIISSFNQYLDRIITWLIDVFLSVPSIVLIILISFSFGGGLEGVVLGLAVTHWPTLTRVLRAEILQLKTADYVGISRSLGRSKLWIASYHFLPHLLPQVFIGFILLFPHAILHEATITFLGLGLSSNQASIGIILSESMGYLSTGMWWLAFFPGLSLVFMVCLFDLLGKNLQKWMDPYNGSKG
ncbi:ABC transporter permease [Caldibacillus thermoamylovorans]